MAYNPKALPEKSAKKYETIPTDLYGARCARVIELGKQRDQYGEKNKVVFGFTLPDQTIEIEDESGNKVEKQKMLWTFPVNLPESKNPDAKINKFINALNPEMEGWEDFLYAKCMLDVEEKDIKVRGEDRTVNNIEGITKAPRALEIAEPDCDVYVFDFYNPDLETWNKLSQGRQEQIKEAVDYPGSDLQKLVEGGSTPAEEDHDCPI